MLYKLICEVGGVAVVDILEVVQKNSYFVSWFALSDINELRSRKKRIFIQFILVGVRGQQTIN